MLREIAVLGPLSSNVETTAFLGCEVWDGKPRPHRPVVVVWLPESVVEDPEALVRLRAETARVTDLDHPGLLKVNGLFSFEEGWARVVEFVDGEPLSLVSARIRTQLGGQIPPDWVARIGIDAAEAMQHAHAVGSERDGRPLVHGGLRPDTLMVGFDGRTRVSGFGAGIFARHRTESGAFDPRSYLAPEQILRGRDRVMVATDVYMLSAVLYQLASGLPPHTGAEDLEQAILTEDVAPLPPAVQSLWPALQKGLSAEAIDRFDSMEAFAAALREAADPVDRSEVARVMDQILPPDGFARQHWRDLLASAADPDMVTILSFRDDDDSVPAPGFEPNPVAASYKSLPALPDAAPPAGPPASGEAPAGPAASGEVAAAEASAVESGPTDDAGSTEASAAEPGPTDGPAGDVGPTEASAGASEVQRDDVLDSPPVEIEPEPSEEEGEVTHFGDDGGSRSTGWLIGLVVLAAVVVAYLVVPASRSDDAQVGPPQLPPELVQAALSRPRPEGVVDPNEVPKTVERRRVRIESRPQVDIFWGMERLGRTPLSVELPKVRLELRLTDGDERINTYRVVDVAEQERISFVLEPATVTLIAPAGAEVKLNGRRIGTAPVPPLKVYEGDYLIEVEGPDVRFKRVFRADSGQAIELDTAGPGD